MKYRRNPDADIRELEREYQATGFLEAFLKYRRALARTGHRDILAYRRGMFLVSVSGGSFDYIKTLGANYANLVGSWEFEGSSSPEELKKKKGRRIGFDSDTLRSWHIIVPPELFSHIKTLVFDYYQDQKKKLKERFPDHREDGMLLYAMTQWPSYQENLYKTVVGELESLGYYQALPLSEVFCSSGCGRSMGLDTPARRYKMECFYCWQKTNNFDQKWLDKQLAYNKSHASQFRRNPIDEEIRSLEREVQAGDIESCFKLIRAYERVGGAERFDRLVNDYIANLLTMIPIDSGPQNCDVHPIVRVEIVVKAATGYSGYKLINVVQKYASEGSYLAKCCELNRWYEDLESAQADAAYWNEKLSSPLQQIYLRWCAYADYHASWWRGLLGIIEDYANKPNMKTGLLPSDQAVKRFERSLMQREGLQPPENLAWSSSANPYAMELLTTLIMVNGPDIEEMRKFLLPTES